MFFCHPSTSEYAVKRLLNLYSGDSSSLFVIAMLPGQEEAWYVTKHGGGFSQRYFLREEGLPTHGQQRHGCVHVRRVRLGVQAPEFPQD